MKKSTMFASALAVVLTFGTGIPSHGQTEVAQSSSKHERHPLIRKAIAALHLAANDLEDASHDFCGHRVDALEAVNNAIDQLGLAIGCDSQSTARPFQQSSSSQGQTQQDSSVAPQGKHERHPAIRKALAALHLAADDLGDASHDFCGHRETALDATNHAIDELGLAIACDQ